MKEEFVNFPPAEAQQKFFVSLAGTSYCDGSYRIRREHSFCMVAEYIIRGKGYIQTGKEVRTGEGIQMEKEILTAKAGDVYLLPIGEDHLYYSDAEDPWEKIWVNVEGALVKLLAQECNPEGRILFSDAGGREYLERIHEIGRNGNLTAMEKHRKSALVFHEFLQYLSDRFYGNDPHWPAEMIRMKNYLDNHITQNVSLKELSELSYLSESQVVRSFRKNLGRTPHEYMLYLKLEEAKKLLKNTRLTVREISEHLNFCDEHYFSSMFRRKAGRTPLAFRRGEMQLQESEKSVGAKEKQPQES